ncbi:amino acid ABC transporter permease [Lonepinella sp. BR2271]|uniref:amino acid ABC transporter permease n=1 Tax=Lonepinella sp. BR2271 TaxID=3434550 RepID=UPI003F6DD0D4
MENRIFDFSVIWDVLPRLLAYLDVTLAVCFFSILFGSLWGILLAWAKLSKNPILSALATGYIYIMRCTPAIVLLFLVFYGLPQLISVIFHYDINGFHRAIFAIITFVLLFGAYMAEVFRAAYSAVSHGQYEAAITVGLSPFKAVLLIMLPQAVVIALPNFANSTTNLLKDSALAYTIGLIDLIGAGNLIIAQNYGAYGVEIYTACILIYWVIVFLLERLFMYVENKLNKDRSLAETPNSQKSPWLTRFWIRKREA